MNQPIINRNFRRISGYSLQRNILRKKYAKFISKKHKMYFYKTKCVSLRKMNLTFPPNKFPSIFFCQCIMIDVMFQELSAVNCSRNKQIYLYSMFHFVRMYLSVSLISERYSNYSNRLVLFYIRDVPLLMYYALTTDSPTILKSILCWTKMSRR